MDLFINSCCFVKRENILRQYIADLVNISLIKLYTTKLGTIPAFISNLIKSVWNLTKRIRRKQNLEEPFLTFVKLTCYKKHPKCLALRF